jgi:serine/threonine protein kinase
MNCSACRAPNRDDARFCGVCGAATSATEPASNPSLGEAPAMIGREIAGRYRMLAKLGEGGMGTVFRAEQISLKRTVAVKLLRPDVLGNQMLLRRFNAEAEAVAKLSHPNTVNIYDFGQDTDGTLFIAMEYIEGRSLRTVIQHEAPLSPRRALSIATQVAASLADAHAHAIVHRDLKPDNVMLQDRGRERDIARVLDFGIAKLRDDTRATQMQMTQQGDMLGTPQYMAPEQIRAEAIDGRTDIYALGCLIYEMVTARLPHEAPTVMALLSKHLLEHPVPPSQRRPELGLPRELDALIQGAMAKDPAARPTAMEAFGEQIAALAAAQPPDPHGAPRSAPGPVAMPATFPPNPAPPYLTPSPPAPYPTSSPPYPTPSPPSPYPSPPAPSPPYPPPQPYAPYAAPPSPYAPHAAPGSPYAPPYAPAPAVNDGAPPRFALPPPPSRKKVFVALAAILAIGAAVAAVFVVGRSHRHKAKQSPADVLAAAGDDSPDKPDKDDKDDSPDKDDDPQPSEPDPWSASASPPAPHGDTSTVVGDRLEVGQGVTLIVPPGFQTTVQNGVAAAFDSRGVMIAAAPIDIATNDPRQLARNYAKRTGLVFESMQSISVAGQQQQMAIFRGSFRGVPVRHAAVALIGPRYRMAVVFQAPAQLAKTDPAITSLLMDVFDHRILLP